MTNFFQSIDENRGKWYTFFNMELFSFVSGYIMIYTTQSAQSDKGFLLKRGIRLIPLYWTLTIFYYGIICDSYCNHCPMLVTNFHSQIVYYERAQAGISDQIHAFYSISE